MKKLTIEQMIDRVYDELFDFICDENDDLYDLIVEYKSQTTGKTIRKSWHDREIRIG